MLCHWVYIGIMEYKMETTILCRDYLGIMENKMDTSILYRGYIGVILGQWNIKWKVLCQIWIIVGLHSRNGK